MPFKRGGDSSATYPKLLRVRQLPGADDRSVMEVYGWLNACFDQSALHLTDYVVDHSTAAFFAGESRVDQLVRWCLRAGLITREKVDGLRGYRLIDDPDFIHIRTRAEVESERQQAADGRNDQLKVPVVLRDGDNCRYTMCGGVPVTWLGRPGKRTATLDHLDPGVTNPPPDRVVVACRSCNSSLRDMPWEERKDLLLEVPATPRYSSGTAAYLAKHGHQVVADDEQPATPKRSRAAKAKADTESAPRPSSRPAAGGATRDPANQRAARSATSPTGERRDPATPPAGGRRDPATAPHRGSRRDGSTADDPPERHNTPAGKSRPESTSGRDSQGIGRVGTGRDGSGRSSAFPNPAGTARSTTAGTRRRRRGSRGGTNRGQTR